MEDDLVGRLTPDVESSVADFLHDPEVPEMFSGTIKEIQRESQESTGFSDFYASYLNCAGTVEQML